MNIKLSDIQYGELRKLQRNMAGTPGYVRVTCILMLHNGRSPQTVSEDLGISLSCVYRYISQYQKDGIDELLNDSYKGYVGRLDDTQIAALRKELKERIYTDPKQVANWILSTFGVKYTQQGVVDLLNRIGFTYKKTTEVPCEADAEAQLEFMEELAKTLKDMDSKAVVYYADGVHPTHDSRSTYAWIEKGNVMEQPTVSGRDRVNINGLLNAYDVTDVIAHDCESVNAQSTRELYEAALAKHPDASCIYIISDNARYYHNKELKEWAENTKIKQIFLPPYSPNLNLIERLWKFLRKKVINTGFYRNKAEFQLAIKNFFARIGDYKEELESLLTLRFRLKNSQTISF
jgi:transposase